MGLRVLLIPILILTIACERESLELDKKDGESVIAPVSSNLAPSNGLKDVESVIALTYSDPNPATSCDISNLSNLTETTACACTSGNCTVGVTNTANYTGTVSFDYTVTVNGVESNASSVSFEVEMVIGATSSEEWIKVPANAGGMGLSEFYVMKYEAKAWNDANTNSTIDVGEVHASGMGVVTGSNVPVSIADDIPWRSISANDAAAECESLGAKYHLISNPEWMAIARDAEGVNANWTGGTVGSGCLFRGYSGDTTCGYTTGLAPDRGTGRNVRAKYILSNGEEVYDIGGNIDEWTDWDKDTVGFQIAPTTCGSSYIELTAVACGALVDADYNTANGTYTSTEGVGRFYGGSGTPGGAAMRGGVWFLNVAVGAFAVNLNSSPTDTRTTTGFRCVYRP